MNLQISIHKTKDHTVMMLVAFHYFKKKVLDSFVITSKVKDHDKEIKKQVDQWKVIHNPVNANIVSIITN